MKNLRTEGDKGQREMRGRGQSKGGEGTDLKRRAG